MSSVSAIRGVLLGCSTRSLRRSCQLPIASRSSAPGLLQQLPRKFSDSPGPQKETTKASQIGGHDYFKSFYYGSHGASELQPTVAGQSPAVVDIPGDALDDDLTPFQEQLASEPNPDALSTEVDPEFLDEVGPGLHRSFNLAAYVNQSETLQKFLQLGVDLSRFDRKPGVPQMILALDFEKDVEPVIRFLTSLGVEPDRLGYLFTKNPKILEQQLENLQVRVDYLLSKKFTKEQVGRIASNAPFFLMFSVRRMDRRLGYLQKTFELTGNEVRHVVARLPKLPTYSINLISDNTFAIKEEMGFSQEQTKQLLLNSPKLFLSTRRLIVEAFDYLHNTMALSHDQLLKFPSIIRTRKCVLQPRHEFLAKLGRDQYDATQPNYVSLKALVSGSDADFCENVAKTSVDTFNQFLKTV
ncbi:unnamed protein product [Ixodes persulcatus]